MRLSFVLAVSVVTIVAVHAGVYPAKAGNKDTGHTKGENNEIRQQGLKDDRFHLQSSDGQYVFGHTTGNQGRAELRARDGTVTGYYSYTGGDGRVVYVNYAADKNGYRVLSNTGVPSASVTIESGAEEKASQGNDNFQKVFADFTKRIKEKIISQNGQKTVDFVDEGQHQVPVDPTFYPTKEIKSSKHDEKNQFPNWNQVKISTTQNPLDASKPNKGQQQQETVDPNWEVVKITTQKPSIKGRDNDGQESNNNDQWSANTKNTLNPISLIPNQSQISTKGGDSEVIFPEERIEEITTMIADSKTVKESIVIDDTKNNPPATEPLSIISTVQTTASYSDAPEQPTKDDSTSQENYQTTISGIKQFEESLTNRYTENEQNIKKTEIDIPTTIRSQDNKSFENVPTTEDPSLRNDFQTTAVSDIDYTTITIRNERVEIINTSPVNEPELTTYQPESKFSDIETTAGIQYVTEENKDLPEFRTLEPTERIGTTMNPNFEHFEAQEQEIIWPQLPQEPIPQVLIPLNPYSEEPYTKPSGVKMHSQNLRTVRDHKLDDKSFTINVTETVIAKTTTTTPAYVNDENTTLFNFPRYFLTG